MSETRPAATSRMSEENVMMPSPPSWMSPRMTAWPNPLNAVAVSTTTSPVTQTAEVAVNSASMKEMRPPRALGGSQSKTAPPRMAKAKLRARTRAGWKNRFLKMALPYSHCAAPRRLPSTLPRGAGLVKPPKIDRPGTVCYFWGRCIMNIINLITDASTGRPAHPPDPPLLLGFLLGDHHLTSGKPAPAAPRPVPEVPGRLPQEQEPDRRQRGGPQSTSSARRPRSSRPASRSSPT